MTLHSIDYLVIIGYFAVVVVIGIAVRRKIATAEDFLTSRHSVPL